MNGSPQEYCQVDYFHSPYLDHLIRMLMKKPWVDLMEKDDWYQSLGKYVMLTKFRKTDHDEFDSYKTKEATSVIAYLMKRRPPKGNMCKVC